MFLRIYELTVDMFPPTTKRTKTVVDQVGRTARQMTYFLSSRAMWKQSAFYREKPNKSKDFGIWGIKWMCVSVSAE